MNLILFDDCTRESLLPFTYTRPICELRVGILTLREKWEKLLNTKVSWKTQEYLSNKYPITYQSDNLLIAGSLVPSTEFISAVTNLAVNTTLVVNNRIVAARFDEEKAKSFDPENWDGVAIEYKGNFSQIEKTYHIFQLNHQEIVSDFNLLTHNRESQAISETVTVVGELKDPTLRNQIFLEEGAEVECAYLNPKDGPIYVGKNAKISEGCMVRGALALCENAQLNMGAKIYGATTLGPFCKVGGEVNNAVLYAYSNKGHDGFLGNSVIGEWCNLGADTNNSNLKNDYSKVRVWDYSTESFARTDLQFCGLMMGDHSRSSINIMFNTGTVVGVGSNIFGAGFPRNFVPSFAFGGSGGYKSNILKKVFDMAESTMSRRNVELTENDKLILEEVYKLSEKYRGSFN